MHTTASAHPVATRLATSIPRAAAARFTPPQGLSQLAALMAAAAMAAVAPVAPAFAQASGRYALREVPQPATATSCTVQTGGLNESGDVAMSCRYKGGTRQENANWCITITICFPYKATRSWYYDLPATWQAGVSSLRALNMSVKASVWHVWMLNSGAVLATGVPIDGRGDGTSAGTAWTWSPSANVGEPFLPPPSLDAPETPYHIEDVTTGGWILWSDLSARQHALQWPDGHVSPVPHVPDNGDVVLEERPPTIHSQGMLVRPRWVIGAPTAGQPDGAHVLQGWFFNGQAWTKMALPPPPVSVDFVRLNTQGQVLSHEVLGATYLWQATRPNDVTKVTNDGVGGPTQLNDAGLMAGSLLIPNDRNGRSKATVWVQGTPIDLNTVTSNLPRGWLLTGVAALNNKGQMVVNAVDTTKLGAAAYKLAVLTPQ